MVDEIRLAIMPVLLGDGLRLFGNSSPEARWRLKDVVAYKTGVVELLYGAVASGVRVQRRSILWGALTSLSRGDWRRPRHHSVKRFLPALTMWMLTITWRLRWPFKGGLRRRLMFTITRCV